MTYDFRAQRLFVTDDLAAVVSEQRDDEDDRQHHAEDRGHVALQRGVDVLP